MNYIEIFLQCLPSEVTFSAPLFSLISEIFTEGFKSKNEKFAGAVETLTVEAFISDAGKG